MPLEVGCVDFRRQSEVRFSEAEEAYLSKNARNSIEIEGRLELAISAIKKQEVPSIREAARLFEVPYSTLCYRLNGRPARTSLRANSTKLTEAEENLLVQWILDLAKRGSPPRPAFVENMANHLLTLRHSTSNPPRVGKNWVSNLIKRRTELKCCYSRRYNYERAKCEDRKVIQQLDIQLQTPTPPASQSSNSQSSWILQAPSNPRQLHRQVDKIKNLMGQGLESSPQGLMEGFDQIIKACEYGMVSATIMKKQYQDIFAANEKEKQKRKRSRRQIQHEGGLTREEAQALIIPPAEVVELPAIQPSEAPASEPARRSRAPSRCTNCQIVGHTRRSCPNPSVI
ncbi:conserved hypothetical protein [Coccidioides posadasii str. Silveira]|uniref:HTH CENPB-type domain-containing protein n=1 Tax=Coccidioides posadasii (strain RMSCC 757 / Silveira) TaxID=443226 RepID=E9D6I1_COCPS|nr:conserved hypothetical protein [Coccidioides posadasii str. Silveira]